MNVEIRITATLDGVPIDDLATVYQDAFALPPYRKGIEEVRGFTFSLPYHVKEEGFLAALALEKADSGLVGFAYGFNSAPNQLWYREIARVASPELVAKWLNGSFRLVEFAVSPKAQRQGIGARLHDTLLSQVTVPRVVLLTIAADSPAYHLYLNRGWTLLVDHFIFSIVERPYRLMGLELHPSERGPQSM